MRFAEIDIVARKGGKYFFIEVKYRRQKQFGTPQEAINALKRLRLMRAVNVWLAKNNQTENNFGGILLVSVEEISGELLCDIHRMDL